MKEKVEVRNIPIYYVECSKDTSCVTYNGEYRACLEFVLPYNGKNKRAFRMNLSPTSIAYLRECLDKAEELIRKNFEDSFNG